MTTLIRAIYHNGVFAPTEPVEGLAEDELVELQVRPAEAGETVYPHVDEVYAQAMAELEGMTPRERLGLHEPNPSPEEIEARLRLLDSMSGRWDMTAEQALDLAMNPRYSLLNAKLDL